jgi:predicted ChrR family anti-sigma factor
MESNHVENRLPDYVLGDLEVAESALLEAHVATCPGCARELADVTHVLSTVGLDQAPLRPPSDLRQRLLFSARTGRPLVSFAPGVAALFDLPEDKASRLLAKLTSPEAWKISPAPGIHVLSVVPGASLSGATACFVRGSQGAVFPHHQHGGMERTLVVQGGFLDSDGVECWPGDFAEKEAGNAHSLRILGDEECICAVLNLGPLEFTPV